MAAPIVHIHPTMPPDGGGCETIIASLIGAAAERGIPTIGYSRLVRADFPQFDDSLIGGAGDPHCDVSMRKEYRYSGARIVKTPAAAVEFARGRDSAATNEERLAQVVAFYLSEFRSVAPQLVHVHNLQGEGVQLMSDGVTVAAKQLGIPCVFTAHNVNHEQGSYFPEGYERVVFMSEAAKSAYLAQGAPVGDASVITAGVPLDVFTPDVVASADIAELPGVRIFGLGRSADSQKGMAELVRAVGVADMPTASLALCGIGSDPLPKNRARIDALWDLAESVMTADAFRRFKLVDAPHSAVPSLVAASDIVVIPSTVDEGGWPLALLEAVAMGKPVITTRGGGQEEAVRSIYGFDADGVLVERSDSSGLAERLLEFVASPELRDHYARLGLQPRVRATIDAGRMTDNFLATYADLVPTITAVARSISVGRSLGDSAPSQG